MADSRIILTFALDSQLALLYGCVGYLLVKDVYGTLSLSLKSRKFEYAQEENDNWKRPRRVYCNLFCRDGLLSVGNGALYGRCIIIRHDVGYLCCLSFEHRQCESLRLGMDEK